MGIETKIAWCHHTFNPWRGCTKVSTGCANCYAETLSARNPAVLGEWGPRGKRVVASESMWRQPLKWDREAEEAGERRRVFCASLADVFEDRDELDPWRRDLWRLIDATPNLDWLLLTKRPERWRRCWPLDPIPGHIRQNEGDGKDWRKCPNVWLGTSVENQATADDRIPHLLQTPAAVRFLSVEPLLGPLDLTKWLARPEIPCPDGIPGCEVFHFGPPPIGWVICGGESGRNARPCDTAWVRSIVEQCKAASVPCFVKQFGSRPYYMDSNPNAPAFDDDEVFIKFRDPKGGDPSEWTGEWPREFPEPKHAQQRTG